MKQHIPNILTLARLALTLVMFVALLLTGWNACMGLVAFIAFAVAAVTDFLDGLLARRWQVVTTAGAILDPIADKVLVCGAILGLVGAGTPGVLIPGALILFREFAVSAMREVLAPRGLKLPVTFLAKAKTTLQLVALGLFLAVNAWVSSDLAVPLQALSNLLLAAQVLFSLAAVVTIWTGVEYALAARKALKTQ
jgi:cardiolipin synthase